jgi:hypothetical protein
MIQLEQSSRLLLYNWGKLVLSFLLGASDKYVKMVLNMIVIDTILQSSRKMMQNIK